MTNQFGEHRPLHIETYGDRENRPIVFLHGNGESGEIFSPLAKKLSDSYYIVLIDSPGHGRSYRVDSYSYPEMADAIYATIDSLELDRPLIAGYSDGGIIALLIAMEWPYLASSLLVAGANLSFDGLTDETQAKMLDAAKRQKAKYGSVHPLLSLMLDQEEIALEALRLIHIPVLVTAGEHDVVTPEHSGLIAAAIPQGQLLILDDEDHGSYVVHSTKLEDIIRELRDLAE